MDEDEIHRVHSILHLIFHRNRNQHGRAKWWKWLSILKRTVWKLALSLSTNSEAVSGTASSAEFYKQYLSERVVPRCYWAFSVVVADVQFATLGTILLATLARLAKSTGIGMELKPRAVIESTSGNVSSSPTMIIKGKEDLGEALARDEVLLNVTTGSVAHQPSQPSLADSAVTPSEPGISNGLEAGKPKKRKKKKNVIDDLFDRFI
ncbi:hypothetical protein BJX61DRAFT_537600 [Aspergillus egyptiacus]|nr:hypothetical protein BJX61DRAFT_537600 [Aspergillus egyptiacus]